MKTTRRVLQMALLFLIGIALPGFAQKDNSQKKDTTAVKINSGDNRNIMLNAADSRGPREVNIGLPATVGGTTVLENGLPVVYYFWPEMPTSAWRADASIGKMGTMKMGEVAITTGDVGFAVNSFTRLGSDTHKVFGEFTVNHYGMTKTSANLSGPISKAKGWYYTASALVNLDPGNYNIKFRTWEDNTQIYRAGISKRWGKKADINLLYKFAYSSAMTNYGPFIYKKGGEVKEYDGFKLGQDSYYPVDGKVVIKDLFSDTYRTKDYSKGDPYTHSNTIDLFGNYNFDNGMKLNYVFRYHDARSITASYRQQSVIENNSSEKERYVYVGTNEKYSGKYIQTGVAKFSERPVPVRSFTSKIELSKQSGNHSWRIGFNEWYYRVKKFTDNSVTYLQEVAAQPRRLEKQLYDEDSNTWKAEQKNSKDGFYGFNSSIGYHDGQENRTAIYLMDNWKVNRNWDMGAGMRLTLYSIWGNYLPYRNTRDENKKPVSYAMDPVKFDETWLLKTFTFNTVYKITKKFGALAEFTYNEDRPRLENYSGADITRLKNSAIPMGQVGLYFNDDKFSVVSSFNYANKSNYQKRLTLTNPTDLSNNKQETTYYDIETLGWTTDIVTKPFKNFNLHFLLTIQSPKYKNYSGSFAFDDKKNPGSSINVPYDYDGKIVNGISKVLMEIDPSYQWNKLRIWASARYFSKQYANLYNVLYFKSRWETFAGVSYKQNKHLDYSLTVVNPLGQKGAKGGISGSDMIKEVKDGYTTVMSGSYIRPFTVEGKIRFNF